MPERPTPLPPLQTLRAFESAARLASFTRAAHELSVTQGAVSRQIRNLEERLGVTLFVRGDRGVRLTPAGSRYDAVIREALESIARATGELAVRLEQGPVTVGATSAIASLWLMPRLTGFRHTEPDLDIRVLASDRDFERASEEVDLVIEYARRPVEGEDVSRLFEEEIFPVCSPDYLRGRAAPAEPADLLGETLLALDDDHPDWTGWAEWLAEAGVEGGPARRPVRINNYPALLQAAVAGQGIALGWRHLVDDFLAAGSLVPLMPERAQGSGAFYVRGTRPLPPDSPVGRLRTWLEQAGEAVG
jgi:LysR family glycine cleavage system transcriptional activator